MDKRYKLIIFDLDGTLINSLPYHFLAFKDLLLEHNIRIDDKELRKLIGMSTTDILNKIKKKYRFRENVQDLREERRFHYFKFLGNRNIVFPDVKRILNKLKFDYKLALATGSSKIIFRHSTDRDFQEIFDFVVTINDVKKGKPHPAQFLFAAGRLRVKPRDCLVIGDSIYDALAAKHAKMDFIGIIKGYNKKGALLSHGAVRTIDSIKELEKILKAGG